MQIVFFRDDIARTPASELSQPLTANRGFPTVARASVLPGHPVNALHAHKMFLNCEVYVAGRFRRWSARGWSTRMEGWEAMSGSWGGWHSAPEAERDSPPLSDQYGRPSLRQRGGFQSPALAPPTLVNMAGPAAPSPGRPSSSSVWN